MWRECEYFFFRENQQTIHMKCQVLFSLKSNKKKIFRMLSATILLTALTLKTPITTAADDTFKYFLFINFS